VDEFAQVMSEFGNISGLKINNAKSVVWFSNRVIDRMKQKVLGIFLAQEPNDQTTYLGYLVPLGFS
jgi:hypothetical protein